MSLLMKRILTTWTSLGKWRRGEEGGVMEGEEGEKRGSKGGRQMGWEVPGRGGREADGVGER